MSGKLDRRDEVRFKAYLEANHYIPDNKKGSGGSHYKYISTLTGYHVEICLLYTSPSPRDTR